MFFDFLEAANIVLNLPKIKQFLEIFKMPQQDRQQ